MTRSYSRTLLMVLTISATALAITPERSHTQAAETGRASPSLKTSPQKSVPYLLAKKRSAEFVPSDPVNVHMASILSKRFPAQTKQGKDHIRPVPTPNTIPGIQTLTLLTGSSSDKLKSRKAQTPSFAPGGSVKDIGHNLPRIQKNKSSEDDNELATTDLVREDTGRGSATDRFLQNLIENAVRMLDYSVQSSVSSKYRAQLDSAHKVQIQERGFGFMKRKAKTEGKRPFDSLASGLIGKRSVNKGIRSNKGHFEPLD